MAKQSRLEISIEPTEFFGMVRDRLAEQVEELADAGETITGDQLHEIAEKIRAIGVSAS